MNEIEHSWFGKGTTLHHVGLAVQSIDETSPSSETVSEPVEGVTMTFIDVHGVRVELLQPLNDESPIARSLREGVKLLHLCFEVPDIDAALTHARESGFHCIRKAMPIPAMDNRRTAWVFSKQFGLHELVESADAPRVTND